MSLSRFIITKEGESVPLERDKIVRLLREPAIDSIDIEELADEIIQNLAENTSIDVLIEDIARIAVFKATYNIDYATLAVRVLISHMHRQQVQSFSESMEAFYAAGIIRAEIIDIVREHKETLNAMIQPMRDYLYDFFGLKTLEKAYLLFDGKGVRELPQYLHLRVALELYRDNMAEVAEYYELLSQHAFTHATPTMYNACTMKPQMSSCFLLTMEEDSLEGIFNTVTECATISKYSGGIGLSIHKVRAENSRIRGINGKSNGILPMLKMYESASLYANQGGKRNGSFAIYLEPWHADIEKFLELRLPQGDPKLRTPKLFTALWIPDLFMERVQTKENWSLFCPDECPNLYNVHGAEFVELYTKYEREGRARKVLPANDIWDMITISQIEAGMPYILYKDTCNAKSNQKNLGTIQCSNLCTEIIQYSSPEETAVCNLASLSLPYFVDREAGEFNFERLRKVVKKLVRGLNSVIDKNYYPVEKARYSNMRHRPTGVGVQGLADTFFLLNLPFSSPEAKVLNRKIFEHMYFAALEESCDLATRDGPYSTFSGSPASQGILQFDMWSSPTILSPELDWVSLKKRIVQFGLRNSLLIAPMPTASTSQILGNVECFEPVTNNFFSRKTLSGTFQVCNKYLAAELRSLGLYTRDIIDQILADGGSVQKIDGLSPDLKDKYRIAWEIKSGDIIDMAADRGAFICQSQSMNIYTPFNDTEKVTKINFYSWKKGLKTGVYYLRVLQTAQAEQVTVRHRTISSATSPPPPSIENEEICESCSA